MKNQDYTITINVNANASEAFKAINNVTKWWTENLEGNSQKLNDEFTVRFDDVHVSTQKIVEFVPDKKVVWLVTDSRLNFVEDKKEWTGTKISFEVVEKNGRSQIVFTHQGLIPAIQCYDGCSGAWGQYITESLLPLLNEGKGKPELKSKKQKAEK
ncbi:MAG TPA: SRPBCC domain-containing protein [Cyclobacteriaceae bacterium]